MLMLVLQDLKNLWTLYTNNVSFLPTKIMLDDSRKLKIKSYDGTKSETK